MSNYLVNQNNLPDDFEDPNYCYICFESQGEIIRTCKCTGTTHGVHRECLEKWIQESNKNYCMVCNYRYKYELLFNPSCKRFYQQNSKCDSYCCSDDEEDNIVPIWSILIIVPVIIFVIIMSFSNINFYYHNLVIFVIQVITLGYLKNKKNTSLYEIFNILKCWQISMTIIFSIISFFLMLFNSEVCYNECYYNQTICEPECPYYPKFDQNLKYYQNLYLQSQNLVLFL